MRNNKERKSQLFEKGKDSIALLLIAQMEEELLSPAMLAEGIDREFYQGYFWRNEDYTPDNDFPRRYRISGSKPFRNPEPELGMEPDYVASFAGLSEIQMSGSAQFNANQIKKIISSLKKVASGDIWVVDLRQECHFFVNGIPVSWYGRRDWGNVGLGLETITSLENLMMRDVVGKNINISFLDDDNNPRDTINITVNDVANEKNLVEETGAFYYRVPLTGHLWPMETLVDEFVSWVKDLPPKTWLHFHCVGGQGRTAVYMAMYDIMQNPSIPLKDIVYRHYQLGGRFLLFAGDDDWKKPYYQEKKRMLTLFYDYVQECRNGNYSISWSDWLKTK